MTRMNRTRTIALAAMVVVVYSTIPAAKPIIEKLSGEVTFEEALSIVRTKEYSINGNANWQEIQVAGMKLTEKSWNGFLQVCERLILKLGSLQVYVDAEIRLMWVLSDPSANPSDTEVYYLKL